jgi:hypothetical protein
MLKYLRLENMAAPAEGCRLTVAVTAHMHPILQASCCQCRCSFPVIPDYVLSCCTLQLRAGLPCRCQEACRHQDAGASGQRQGQSSPSQSRPIHTRQRGPHAAAKCCSCSILRLCKCQGGCWQAAQARITSRCRTNSSSCGSSRPNEAQPHQDTAGRVH